MISQVSFQIVEHFLMRLLVMAGTPNLFSISIHSESLSSTFSIDAMAKLSKSVLPLKMIFSYKNFLMLGLRDLVLAG